MARDETEWREDLWEQTNDLLDVAGQHTKGLEQIRDLAQAIYDEVTKPVEGDGLVKWLKDVAVGVEKNTLMLEQILARLPAPK